MSLDSAILDAYKRLQEETNISVNIISFFSQALSDKILRAFVQIDKDDFKLVTNNKIKMIGVSVRLDNEIIVGLIEKEYINRKLRLALLDMLQTMVDIAIINNSFVISRAEYSINNCKIRGFPYKELRAYLTLEFPDEFEKQRTIILEDF